MIQILSFLSHNSGTRGESVRSKFKLDSSFVVEAAGYSGGIWCLCDSSTWKINVLEHTNQIARLKVSNINFDPWLLLAVYGSPQRLTRKHLWNGIRSLSDNINIPWCILGDFNAMLHDYERSGGSNKVERGACFEFQSCLSDCGLVDIGYTGWPFTWRRGNFVERLDRGLTKLNWHIAFPKAIIKHLSIFKSDHAPLCLQLTNSVLNNRQRKSFCFIAA
ncbi:hypothetical protein AHAS_Ahas02G0106500 [Arachis hypogaea]